MLIQRFLHSLVGQGVKAGRVGNVFALEGIGAEYPVGGYGIDEIGLQARAGQRLALHRQVGTLVKVGARPWVLRAVLRRESGAG
ncbi:hypothetical protein [Pseudomonas typographi]|uniref:Uncharacterized protein n=1 Tax=Pseudomonas typographi TaxID=2715964 RepID=A0ABR7YYS3_9PSED|nr:hypothetical protein [Pseudomonas typographi]MBD1550819.1 hypothetical protein [Pseudomonas typographi]MBD1587761.1 hypothetical protein [Pseudomonas typographi]MBD1598284.1 hypothetical protein [Pseudomonas typographi]